MLLSRGEKVINVIIVIFLCVFAFLCVAPVVHMLAISLSHSSQVAANRVIFWPLSPTLASYEYIVSYFAFWRAMLISFQRVILSTFLTLFMTVLSAYPLSKGKELFMGRGIFAWVFFIPMLISGGLIPTYLVISNMNLLGSIWALVLPAAVSPFYVLIMLNFFRGVPEEIEEAAMIDGAGRFTILIRIILPISLPVLATITVFCSLAQWNEWFNGIIYMKMPIQYPLMSYLQTTVLRQDFQNMTASEMEVVSQIGQESFQAAQLTLAAIPMMLVYPFLQKYFAKGLTLGSVKG